MTFVQESLFTGPPAPDAGLSAAGKAVLQWSDLIHGKTGDRHEWGAECARLLDEHGPDADLPLFPSQYLACSRSREVIARRRYREALAIPRASL